MGVYQTRLKELEERTTAFSVDIIKECRDIQEQTLRPIINQVVRSATSIGANYAEANNASSKTDFRSKIYIAKKEAAETRYWLKVLSRTTGKDLGSLQQEALEFVLIFQKIISTMKMKNGKQFVK
jgi:four helix bundle protein